MEVGKFVGGVVGVVVSVLMITALGIPVIQSAVTSLTNEQNTNADIIQMLEVIPLLLVVAVIVGIVALFISRRD